MPQYRVEGVDRDSGMETSLIVVAQSEANAKAMGELKGVLVTAIQPLDLQSSQPQHAVREIVLTSVKPHMIIGFPGLFIFGVVTTLFLIGFLILISIALACWAQRITVTSKRVTMTIGILSRSTSEVRIGDVRNIIVRQSLLQRITGGGSIGVASAGQGGIEVMVRGIANVKQVQAIIDQARSEFQPAN